MTDPFAAAVAAAQVAQQAAGAKDAENAALRQRVADLEAQLRGATRWGANASNPTERAANGTGLAPKIWRAFVGEGDPLRLPFALADDEVFALTFKRLPADVLSGAHDAEILAMVKSAPTDRTFYLDYWHEPEDEIAKGEFTAAQYVAAYRHVAQIARQAGPHVRMTLALMNFTLMPSSGRNWRDYYPGDDVVDVMAWDAYQYSVTWESPTGPADLFKAGAAVAASVGKPWAIAETGIDNRAYTGQARIDALTALAHSAATASTPPLFVCYFLQDPRWKLSAAETAAWKAGQRP